MEPIERMLIRHNENAATHVKDNKCEHPRSERRIYLPKPNDETDLDIGTVHICNLCKDEIPSVNLMKDMAPDTQYAKYKRLNECIKPGLSESQKIPYPTDKLKKKPLIF